MSLSAIAAFWGVSFLLVMTPGADWAYAISAGLRERRLVLPAVFGLACGALLATLAVAAGVGALVARHPMVLTLLTVAGCAYLLWMGIGMWRSPGRIRSGEGTGLGGDTPWRWAVRGAGVSGLNPKLGLLLLALLPQFVRPAASWSVAAQIMALGAVHAASCCVVYSGVGMASQKVLGTRPAAARLVSRLSGALMIGIALLLAVDRALH